MKLKSLDFPTGYFYFDNAAINSDKVEVIAVGYRNTDKTIKIFIEDVIHFRVVDESYFIDTFMDLISEDTDRALLHENGGQSFFELLDECYAEWILKESYFPLNREFFKYYIFMFEQTFIEIIGSSATYSIIEG